MANEQPLDSTALEIGLPVALRSRSDLQILLEDLSFQPVAFLQHGHPGKVRHWRYGVDHLIVEWFGVEDADVSTDVGWARDGAGIEYPGLSLISEDDYAGRCEFLSRNWWYLKPELVRQRRVWRRVAQTRATLLADEGIGSASVAQTGVSIERLESMLQESERRYREMERLYRSTSAGS